MTTAKNRNYHWEEIAKLKQQPGKDIIIDGNAAQYNAFLFEYLTSRQLPDDAMKFLCELEQ